MAPLQTTRPMRSISWLLTLSLSPLLIGCATDGDSEHRAGLSDSVPETEMALYADSTFRLSLVAGDACQGNVVVQVRDEFGDPIRGVTVVGEFTGDSRTTHAKHVDQSGFAAFASPVIKVGQTLQFHVTAISDTSGARLAELEPFDAALVATCAQTPAKIDVQFGIATSPVQGETNQLEDCTCGIATSPRLPVCDNCGN